ncbi:MAG: hypothetical protein WA799_08915 [Nitrosotalea sp.]
MEEYKWNFALVAKGGQNVKEKDESLEVTNKEPEHSLKVKIVATEDSVDAVTEDIISKIGDLKEVSFTIEGNETELKECTEQVAKIISKHGKQKTLDLHFSEKEQVEA